MFLNNSNFERAVRTIRKLQKEQYSPSFKKTIEYKERKWKYIYLCYCYVALLDLFIINILPVVKGQIPFYFYPFCNEELSPCFELTAMWQGFGSLTWYLVCLGYDGVFISFVTSAYFELEKIKYNISNMPITLDSVEAELLTCLIPIIRHHDAILK